MTNTREERVARAIVDATQGQLARLFGESSKLGGFDGYTEDGKAEALEVARAAIAALSVEPSPDVWEAIRKVRDGYVSQMKFCDIEALGYFREFVRRIDKALPDPPKATEDRA